MQWWEISVPSLSVVQRAIIGGPGDPYFRAYPTLAANANNDLLIGYSIFSATSNPSAAYSFRLGTDTPSTWQSEGDAGAGEGVYTRNDDSRPYRWGDYSATVVDPINDRDMWTIQESSGAAPDVQSSTPWKTTWNRISKVFGRFSGGLQHSVGQRAYSYLAASGQGLNGQLGNGGTSNSSSPVFGGLYQTIDVAAGDYNNLAATPGGSVYAWGSNQYGQLGLGYPGGQTSAPTPVPNLNLQPDGYYAPVSTGFGDSPHAVSSNFGVCAAVDSRGQVWTWGVNYSGQLGDGTTADHYSPAVVRADPSGNPLTRVVSIAAGEDQMIALKSDGTVWAWGSGNRGALGVGATYDHNALYPVQVYTDSGPLTDVVQVVAGGSDFALALKKDGSIWGWGSNGAGQLGVGDQVDRGHATYIAWPAERIAAGAYHALARSRDNGWVFSWGYNGYGQCGYGEPGSPGVPVIQLTPRLMEGVNWSYTDVAAGAYFSLMSRVDTTVWGVGDNQSGQLAVGDTAQRNYPTQSQY